MPRHRPSWLVIVTNDGYRNHTYLLPLMRLALMRLALDLVFWLAMFQPLCNPLSIVLSTQCSALHSVLYSVLSTQYCCKSWLCVSSYLGSCPIGLIQPSLMPWGVISQHAPSSSILPKFYLKLCTMAIILILHALVWDR